MQPKQRGFSLIELMIVVAIIGILAAIAYPSYRDSVFKSRRADAQQSLLQAAQAAERYFVEKNTYEGFEDLDLSSKVPDLQGLAYSITVLKDPKPTGSSFVIRALPISGKADEKDVYLEIDQTGRKKWARKEPSGTTVVKDSWSS